MSVSEQHATDVPRIGGVPVDVRLARLIPELSPRMVRMFAERLPSYASLPGEELAGDILRACEDHLRSAVRLLRDGARPDSRRLSAAAHSAARRAEEGLPLSAVLSAYHLGWQLALDALLEGADESELGDVRTVQRHALDQLRLVSATVADAYVEHMDALYGQRQTAQQVVLCALLDGTDPSEAARRAGLRLAPAYAVLTLAFDEHPDEREPGVSQVAAARRKVRRAEAELDHHGRGQSLHSLGAQGGRALLPVADAESALSAGWAELSALVARMSSRTGASVHAGIATAPTETVGGAVRESAEVLDVVRASERPPGAYRVTDVLLDYQLSRPGAAGRHLAALLAPLRDHRVLLYTLTVYADCGFRRRETAAALHVHPNTVDYRLRRVALLTGLDPADSADLPRLHAALTVHRVGGPPLRRGGHPPPR